MSGIGSTGDGVPEMTAHHRNQRLSVTIGVILSAVPLLALIVLLYRYSVNVPFQDQWDVIYLFDQYDNGTLSFSDFWRQHNEHRLVLPKLLFLLLGIITSYDVRYEIAVNVGIAFLNYAVIALHIRKNRLWYQIDDCYHLLWGIVSVFIFSLVQWQNWLWGFQIPWFLNLLAVISGAYIISNYPITIRTVGMLFLCGLVATFSLAGGVGYWLIILFVLLIHAVKSRQKRLYQISAGWMILFAMVLTAYLYDYQKPEIHPNPLFFLYHPIPFLEYVFAYIGAPLAVSLPYVNNLPYSSIVIGCLGISLFLMVLIRELYHPSEHHFKNASFFLIIGLFSIFNAVITAIGRSEWGIRQAMESRYTTMSILLWLSLFVMLFKALRHDASPEKAVQKWFEMGRYALLGFIFIMLNWTSVMSIPQFHQMRSIRIYLSDAMVYKADSQAVGGLHPNTQRLIDVDIPILKRLQLSLFQRFPELNEHTVFLFPETMWRHDNGWSINGMLPNIRMNKDIIYSYFFSSCGTSLPKTGRIESEFVRIDKPSVIRMMIDMSADMREQKIGVWIDGESPVELSCDLQSELSWMPCSFDLTPYIGRSFKIIAEDNSADSNACVGFVQPVMVYLKW